MSLQLLFGEGSEIYTEWLIKINPNLSQKRASLLSQSIAGLGEVKANPIKLQAWVETATEILANAEDKNVMTVLEILQNMLKNIIEENS